MQIQAGIANGEMLNLTTICQQEYREPGYCLLPRPDINSLATHLLCLLPQNLSSCRKLSLTTLGPSLDPMVCSLGRSGISVAIAILQVLLYEQISDRYLCASAWNRGGHGIFFLTPNLPLAPEPTSAHICNDR